jgi:hypothetical protein
MSYCTIRLRVCKFSNDLPPFPPCVILCRFLSLFPLTLSWFLSFFFLPRLVTLFGNGVVVFHGNETHHLTKASGSAVSFFALRRSVTIDVELQLNR